MEPDFPTFPKDEQPAVPGEVLVKLTPEGSAAVTESIPSGPRMRLAAELPNRFGLDALDSVASEAKVESLTRVHAPHSPFTVPGTPAAALVDELAATYRVKLGGARPNVKRAVERFQAAPTVAEASPNYYRYATATPNDPMFGLEWGLTKINCSAAWDREKGSPNVVVAVVDTGADLDHPDLAAQLLPGNDLVDMTGVAPQPGWHFEGDFLTRDNVPQDEVGHGTHVAGTIAAITDNAVGVAGVTWFCRILPVRVLVRMVNNTTGQVTGIGTSSDIAAGIRWAADNGAHVINLSLSGTSDTFVERDAVAYAIAHNVVVVAAMGNEGDHALHFPAAYPDVVSVGAIDQSDHRASFSNMGPHIDVVGPGVGVRSTVWDNGYADFSGTSMATPHVAGVAALIRSCNSTLTAADTAQILRTTARNLRDQPGDPVPNDNYGFGVVDAKAAVDRACPKLKVRDDIFTRKTIDDIGTRKFLDDIGTLKAPDDVGTRKLLDDIGTQKAIDDPTKLPPQDPPKGPLDPKGFDPGPGPGPAPFALSTPHHSMAWAGPLAGGSAADYEQVLAQYEAALTEAEDAAQAGTLSEAEQRQVESIRADYQALAAEYQQIRGAG
jgi:subtilisin family serine protease